MRKELGLFANLRPAVVLDQLIDASTLKEEVVRGVDIMVVRELTGDVYFGTPKGIETKNGERFGFNNMCYYEHEVKRIAKVAFDIAMKRGKKVCSIDKANVLDVSQLWRDVMIEESAKYPEVRADPLCVGAFALTGAPSLIEESATAPQSQPAPSSRTRGRAVSQFGRFKGFWFMSGARGSWFRPSLKLSNTRSRTRTPSRGSLVKDADPVARQVELSHMYVDNAAMQLIRWPKQFDVMVTGNIFGDILSDEVGTQPSLAHARTPQQRKSRR